MDQTQRVMMVAVDEFRHVEGFPQDRPCERVVPKKSPIVELSDAFADLARMDIQKYGVTSCGEAMQRQFDAVPSFSRDMIYRDLFPDIYAIEEAKHTKQNQQHHPDRNCAPTDGKTSDIMEISDAFADLARRDIKKHGVTSFSDAMQRQITAVPSFATNMMYQDMFPPIYSIEADKFVIAA